MEQLERFAEYICECVLRGQASFFILGRYGRFGKLNVPVTVIVPEEVVNRRQSNAQLVFVKVCVDALYAFLKLCENPLVLNRELLLVRLFDFVYSEVHQNES